MTKRPGRPFDATKRDAIIRAASQRFFNAGFAATSIEQVALDAGVSKVTIYNHFGGKRALFKAAVELECIKMHDAYSVEQNSSGSIRQRLLTIAEAMVTFLARPEIIQFDRRIAAETETNPEIGEAFLEAGPRRMANEFTEFLKHAAEEGELSLSDPRFAADQFVGLLKGMADLEQRYGAVVTEEANEKRINGAVDVFLAAYAPRQVGSSDD